MADYISFTLPNGIRCIHKPVRSAVSYCGLTINSGSRDEKDSEHGLAHLIEHCMFKGTKKRKAHHINNRLENLGGELNAFTTKEETVVHATVLKKDFPKAAELIADMVFHSVFPEKEVEKEKEVVIDEINSYKDSPVERIYDDFEDLLFAGSSLGHNILGRKNSLKKFRPAHLSAFRDRTYDTRQMVFSSVGNIPPKKFSETCRTFFGEIPENDSGSPRLPVADAVPFDVARHRATHQAHCLIGTRGYSSSDPCRYALSLLVNILGGTSANSILNTVLREKNGLTYHIEASYVPFSDTGMVGIYFGSEKERAALCQEMIREEIHRLLRGDYTERRFGIAKKQFLGQLAIATESNEGNMLGAGKSFLLYNKVHSLAEVARKIDSITRKDILEIANEIFGRELSVITYT